MNRGKEHRRDRATAPTLIVHVSYVFGGAERSLLDFLQHSPHGDRYILALHPATELYMQAVRAGFTVCPLDVRYIGKKNLIRRPLKVLGNLLTGSWRLWRLCRREGVERIYCNTHRSLVYMGLIRFTRRSIVCHCRDNPGSWAERWLLRSMCSDVLAVSRFVADRLRGAKSVRVIPNAIRIPGDLRAEDLRSRYGVPSAALCVGMVGSLLRWKNQLDLLRIASDAVKRRPEMHFFIIGPVVDFPYEKELREFVRQNGLERAVTFTGPVVSGCAVMAGLDVVLHTALGEPFGRVVAEAMALGLPVVAYDSGGPGEWIVSGETGVLVPSDDVREAVSWLLRLGGSPGERRRIGEQAHNFAVRYFDMERYVDQVEESLSVSSDCPPGSRVQERFRFRETAGSRQCARWGHMTGPEGKSRDYGKKGEAYADSI